MIKTLLVAVALLAGATLFPTTGAFAADISFPPLTGRVVDEVGVLSGEADERLTNELAAHEQRTGQQVVVAVVKSLQGRSIEDYGVGLLRSWGIGQKGKNTGAILLVAPNERKMRIEVGYGLEGDLTDAISSTIINGIIKPRFQESDLQGGIVLGAEQILRTLGDDLAPAQAPQQHHRKQQQDHGSPFAIFLTFFIFALFFWLARRSRGGGGSAILPFLIASSWSSRGGGYSGGGFDGGGFSGGGGSGGGGGASGSW
ncbi:MAG TPA: TPM domain-containing protein [Alphaproteobacteria bacterium]|nr:TPM domain-containing protein [Alphaproteobacteria bacterium]